MSTPNPLAIHPEHREAIVKFISEKATEDGIVDQIGMLELIFEYWDIVKDRALVTAEASLIELGRLKDGVTDRQAQLDDINADIAAREAAGGTRTTRPNPRKQVRPAPAPAGVDEP
jgi:hypothetical protein